MYKLGITGGIGSGKSLVCRSLEAMGIPVYNADKEARRLMETDLVLVAGIRRIMGDGAYRDGQLERKWMAERLFADAGLLGEVNALVHPAVGKDFSKWADGKDAPYVVEEAALLVESGAIGMMDMNVLVYAPEELRIRRVMERDGVSRRDVEQRMQHQMDENEKMKLVDKILFNDEEQMLIPQLVALHEEIIKRK